MAHIFISYARADGKDFAFKLHDALEIDGIAAWMDRRGGIAPGDHWDNSIETAIKECNALVFVVTPGGVASDNCHDEWAFALHHKKPVLPLLVIQEELPMRLFRRQYIDFRSNFDQGMASLRDKIRRLDTEEGQKEQAYLRNEEAIIFRPGAAQATRYADPDDLADDYLPDTGLFGRDALIAQISQRIKGDNVRLLLQGFGGAGKTTLAAKIAYDFGGVILWQRLGASEADAIYEALGHPFGAQKAVAAAQSSDEKRTLVRGLLKDVSLVVLDDAWNENALHEIVRCVPRSVPLLVTSRQKSAVFGGNGMIAVPDLPEDDALALLRQLAGEDLTRDENACRELVREVGGLAFAVEVAGRTMAQRQYKADEFLKEVQSKTIADYDAKFGGEGRESVARLIQASVDALPEAAQAAYHAWGAFWSVNLTPEMLGIYQEQPHEQNDSSDVGARSIVPDAPEPGVGAIHESPAYDPVRILDSLAQSGLALRIPAQTHDDGRPQSAAYYRLHDLAYTYTRSQAAADSRNRALNACLAYTERYNQPSLTNFAALVPQLDNFMGAAEYAYSQERWQDAERFAWNLDGGSEVLDYLGYSTQAQTLLTQAASAAEKRGDKDSQAAHLNHRGLIHRALAQYDQAIEFHKQAVNLRREINDKRGEGSALGNLGLAYKNLGEYQKAIDFYTQALEIVRELGAKREEGAILSNLGNAYRNLGQYEKAIEYHTQALEIAEEIGDVRGKGSRLGNLGIAYRNLGQTEKAIDFYTQALEIRREIGDRRGEANDLCAIGIAYNSTGRTEDAIKQYEMSLAIRDEIGDIRGKGIDLGNLGNAYSDLGQYEKAIDFYTQALEIAEEIGDVRGKGIWLGNLGLAYADLGQVEKAIDFYTQALEISREIGDRMGESNDLNNLGVAYEYLEDYDRALAYYGQALAIDETLGNPQRVERRKRNIEDAKRKRDGE